MALELIVSNNLELLSDRLITELGQTQNDLFSAHHIVTQTEGMNNWLKKEIAYKTGIAANIHFKKQFEVVNEIYRELTNQKKLLISVEYLTWQLFNVLNENHFKTSFPKVAAYFSDSTSKRFSLASQVADLFDQYQVYRDEMIDKWNRSLPSDLNGSDWQAYLWRKCTRTDYLIDRGQMVSSIIQALELPENQIKLKKKYPFLPFFGMAIMTPLYLTLFQALSEHTKLFFFLVNPAPQNYWIEDISHKVQILQKRTHRKVYSAPKWIGNDLLQNWGRLIKDNFRLLFKDDTYLNQYDDSSVDEPNHTRLLGMIQHQIYHNEPLRDETSGQIIKVFSEDLLRDGSITINACFTPLREVEVLYNYIIHTLAQSDEAMSPRDILVMTTHIDLYAPLIRAVFDNGPINLPYTIADDSIDSDDNLFSALEALLQFNDDTFFAEDVLLLLNHQCIRDRFSITDEEMVRHCIIESGIRFGKEGDPFLETDIIGWEMGLKRLLYGICLPDNIFYQSNLSTFIPLDITEGASAHQLIHFIHFVRQLLKFSSEKTTDRSIKEWIKWIKEWVECLLHREGESDNDDYHSFLNLCDRQEQNQATIDEKISFELFTKSFISQLSKEKRASSFLRGGITICSLIPMRSIPFKIIAMLGLNDRDFPRKDTPVSFSLIDKKVEVGDRNIKENDKHLFLETLICAKERLYMSYIGFNEKTGSKQPPSILLDEMLNYIHEHATVDSTRSFLVTNHPMHGFSYRYNQDDESLYSYFHYPAHSPHIKLPTITDLSMDESILPLSDLLSFYSDPIPFYFNKHLGIYLNNDDDTIPHTEMNDLSPLDNSIILSQLIKEHKLIDPEYFDRLRLSNQLPLRTMGQISYEEIKEKATQIQQLISKYLEDSKETIPINYPLDLPRNYRYTIQGTIDNMYGNTHVTYNTSSKLERKIIKDAIQHLFLNSSTKSHHNSVFLHYKDPENTHLYISELKEIRTDLIQSLIAFYDQHKETLFVDRHFIEIEKIRSEKDYAQKVYKEIFPNTPDKYVSPYAKEAFRLKLFDVKHIDLITQFQVLVRQVIQTVFTDYPQK